jgi:hypothetical protein
MTINWMAAQAVATVALVLTSGGAIAYAALQLRHEREYRSVNNLEKQLSFFLSDSFVAARRRLAQARVSEDGLAPWSVDEPPVVAFEVLDFYEHLGLLVKKGHLDVYDVWHTFYEWAQPVYVDLQPLIENPKSPYAVQYSDLRKLMHAMDQIQIHRMHAKRASLSTLWTPERILDYYRYELEISTGLAQPMSRRARRKAEAAAAAKERNLA